MILFLLTFTLVYGGLHLYAWLRLRDILPFRTTSAAVMALMTIAPFMIRFAEQFGREGVARLLAWPAYIWMGFIFLFSVYLLTVDLLQLPVRLYCRITRRWNMAILSRRLCATALTAALFSSCYALYEAWQIRVEHLAVTTDKLPPGSRPIRIAQVSDVHLGLLSSDARLKNIFDTVRTAGPDILVSTGDLIDGRLSREEVLHQKKRLTTLLAGIPAPLGKFAVSGNHEFYSGMEQALETTRAAGFKVLQDQYTLPLKGLVLLGVDDPGRSDRLQLPVSAARERAMLTSSPNGFRLLLKHRPVLLPENDGRIDLMLSGHTHKGQLLPFYPMTWYEFPLHSGTTRTAKGTLVHVSRGSGTWGPPMRFLAPPEVTVIDIIPAR